jgi:DNA-directed RNA polymerase specialized sigma24 family protein
MSAVTLSRQALDVEALYREEARRLERVVMRRTGVSREVAEDASSFAWAQCWTHRPDRERAFAWLVTTSVREVWRLHEKAARELLEVTVDGGSDPGGDPFERALVAERAARVRRAMGALKPQQR